MISTNSTHHSPSKKLGFPTFSSRASSLPHKLSVSTKPLGWSSGVLVSPSPRSFVLRAESEESEASETVETQIEEEEGNVEAGTEDNVKEEVVKEPRKPRIKLGDVMGVI